MPCFDGPYTIINVDKDHSTITLDLPNSPNIFLTFHTSLIIPYVENNASLFHSVENIVALLPITTKDGTEEHFIHNIINERCIGCGHCYLVHWVGYRPEDDEWMTGSQLKDTEALNVWLAKARAG